MNSHDELFDNRCRLNLGQQKEFHISTDWLSMKPDIVSKTFSYHLMIAIDTRWCHKIQICIDFISITTSHLGDL